MGEKANRLSCRYVSVGISAFITLVDMCHDNLYRFEPPHFQCGTLTCFQLIPAGQTSPKQQRVSPHQRNETRMTASYGLIIARQGVPV